MRSPRSREVDEMLEKQKNRKVPNAKKALTCSCPQKGLPVGSCHKTKSKKSYPSRKGKVPVHLQKYLFQKKK